MLMHIIPRGRNGWEGKGGPTRPTVRLKGGAEGGTDGPPPPSFGIWEGRVWRRADDDNNNNNNPEWEEEAVWLRTHSTRAAKKQAKVPRHAFRSLKRRKAVGHFGESYSIVGERPAGSLFCVSRGGGGGACENGGGSKEEGFCDGGEASHGVPLFFFFFLWNER